ncbi:hypothetical protein H8E88_08955 [candidate division KSB1 bacterium]|nr:hypothetical protein [candidate division KSB1 bacterium]
MVDRFIYSSLPAIKHSQLKIHFFQIILVFCMVDKLC